MNLHVQIPELARIAADLREMCGDDDVLFADMVEGETDIDRIVARLHEQHARDLEMLTGIKERKASLKDREDRVSARADLAKETIGRVLRAAQLSKIELPDATYSVRDGKPKLVVLDKEAVPPGCCRSKVEPDMAAINSDYADAETLPNWLSRLPARDIVTARTK